MEFSYKTKEISKKFVEGEIWFLLNAYSKLRKERDIEGRLLNKKKIGVNSFENSQSLHMEKDPNIKGFTIRKEYSREKAEMLTA